jgi:cobalt/nickel transport system permease protein
MMLNIIDALNRIRLLEEQSEKNTIIHALHPLSKVLVTVIFLIITLSYGKYEISGLLPLIFYPIVVMILGDIPLGTLLQRILFVSPFLLGIGMFNPIFDRTPIIVFPWLKFSGGWISFFSLLIKGILTVWSTQLLISTTGIMNIILALRMLGIPKVFLLQIALTYRYIYVLIEEAFRIIYAYALRSPFKRGVNIKHIGSLMGQLLLRTLDKAERIYASMCCRGFNGQYKSSNKNPYQLSDLIYVFGWTAFFMLARVFNLPRLMGLIIVGVIK